MGEINGCVDEWKDKGLDACIVGGLINPLGRMSGQMAGWTVTQMYKVMVKQVGRNE